ncbi:T9SS type A sorting domain-containing protein [candidate division GN15 bacterium]|nr:T9SS type A sorting domain-containing protein [candidate division GN15 bacterium]
MSPVRLPACLLLVLILMSSASAKPAIQTENSRGGINRTAAGSTESLLLDDSSYIANSNLLMFVSNTGILARDLVGVFGYDAGLFYPYTGADDIIDGTNRSAALFSAGLWIGGKVNDSLRVSMSQYGSEYWPGPMVGGTFDATAATDPDYRVYRLYADSLGANPNQDYLDWPVGQGAPVDGSGNPTIRGRELTWTVFNDANPATHTVLGGETQPIGIEVQQTIWAPDEAGQEATLFIQYILHNRGGNTVDSCFVSFWADPDLGWAEDDLIGCDSSDNLMFVYNADNDDQGVGNYGSTPPSLGIKLVHGPLTPAPGDTAQFDRTLIPDHRNLPSYAIVRYLTGTDPETADSSWNLMRGRTLDDELAYDPVADDSTRFWYGGDPVGGTGWTDDFAADKIMMMTTGPFTFTPGDSQYVLFKLSLARGVDRLESVQFMRATINSSDGFPTDIDDDPSEPLPTTHRLHQNYPNPFNPGTTIPFALSQQSHVHLAVYNLLGQQVTVLIDRILPAGSHTVRWDGLTVNGQRVASGIYLYRLTTEHDAEARKMILLK